MIFEALLNALTGPLLKSITGPIIEIVKLRTNKQISEAELNAKVEQALIEGIKANEKTIQDAATAQFAEFQKTVRASPVIARAYAASIVLMLFVLFWYQWGAPAFELATGVAWPAPHADINYAYLILALTLGGGAYVFRQPGKLS